MGYIKFLVNQMSSSSIMTYPDLISACKSVGFFLSTKHPTELHVPRISKTEPWNDLAQLLKRRVLAIYLTSSRVILPECLMSLTFFLSRGGSFSALITREDAVGSTLIV